LGSHEVEISYLVAENAIKGMLLEVACTPKPGLVDRKNSGANSDMDFMLFSISSASICQYFHRFVMLGLESSDPDDIFFKMLRLEGLKAEKNMFRATGGINTQKGLIFVMGLICAASGRILKDKRRVFHKTISEEISLITEGLCSKELAILTDNKKKGTLSKGEELYLKFGVMGIRGEVEKGLPTVIDHGLPELVSSISRGATLNDGMVNSLLKIMSVSEDTNVIARSDYETLKDEVQPMASEALKHGGMLTTEGRSLIIAMDDYFISRNINPGGSADLLAATIAMYLIDKIQN